MSISLFFFQTPSSLSTSLITHLIGQYSQGSVVMQ